MLKYVTALYMAQKIILPSLLAILFTLIFSIYSLNRHFSFNSHAFDLGIHAQATYLYSQGLTPFSTFKHMVILADHFGPILFLISPFYKLFQGASTLLILQAVFVAFSSIPIYLIALDKTKNVILSTLISLSYLSAPSVLSAVGFDFHLGTISVLPLSLIIASWYFKKWNLYFTFLFFGILFKEDIHIFILGLGIYSLFKNLPKVGILTIVFSLTSFYLIKFKIMPFLWLGAESGYLGNSIIPISDPILLVYLLITNPKIFVDQIFNSPIKLGTIDFVYRQFAFLPLLSPLSWFTIFPALFLRFSSLSTHFWGSGFHYNANLTPFLAVSAVLAVRRFKIPTLPIIILLIFFLVTGGLAPNSMVWTTIQNPIRNFSQFGYIEKALQDIPPEAAVSAQSPLVPHLINREKIYMFPEIYDAEYIILNPSLSNYPLRKEELKNKIDNLRQSKYWQIKKEVKNLIIFQKRS